MELTRRQALAGAGAAATASLAGCLGGGGPYEAGLATVAPSTVEATGYEQVRTTTQTTTATVKVLGVLDREVEARNRLAEYARVVDIPFIGSFRAAVFVAFSTPQISILGQSYNPVADMSNAELAELIQQQYGTVQNLSEESRRDVQLLGQQTRLVRYRGEARVNESGDTVDIYLHVGDPVADAGDYIVPVAAHPRRLDENSTIDTLTRGIEHSAAASDGDGGDSADGDGASNESV